MIRDEQTVTKTFDSQNTPEPIVPSDLMLMNDDPFGNALDNVDEFVELETDLAGFKGWRYELSNGEKSLAAATVVGGVAYYTSFTPALESDKNQCSLTGGGGAMYAFHLHYGTKVYDQLKFTTSYDVPDTAQLYFGEGDSCKDDLAHWLQADLSDYHCLSRLHRKAYLIVWLFLHRHSSFCSLY